MRTASLRPLVLVLVAALAVAAPAVAQPRPAPPKARPAVALLYFDYTGKTVELEQLRKGLARMLISDLGASEAFQIIERERLEEVLAELKFGQTKVIDPTSAAKIGKLLGAQLLVLGGYFDLGGKLRCDARVVEVLTGKVVKSVGVSRKGDEFLELEQRLATDLGEALTAAAGAAPPAPGKAPPRARPAAPPKRLKSAIAARYGRALDAKDRGDKQRARAELAAVVKEQPDFTLAATDLAALAR
ncbi:MAG TPA: CsgG/HfaB family protein [Polyangia bacterium]